MRSSLSVLCPSHLRQSEVFHWSSTIHLIYAFPLLFAYSHVYLNHKSGIYHNPKKKPSTSHGSPVDEPNLDVSSSSCCRPPLLRLPFSPVLFHRQAGNQLGTRLVSVRKAPHFSNHDHTNDRENFSEKTDLTTTNDRQRSASFQTPQPNRYHLIVPSSLQTCQPTMETRKSSGLDLVVANTDQS